MRGVDLSVVLHDLQWWMVVFNGSESSATGFPEGDPLSVWAMYIITWYVAWSIEQAFPMVAMRAYADNWELTGNHPHDLVQSAEYLSELARINRLDFSTGKCYGWSTGSDTRLYLHRSLIIQGKQIAISYGAKNLGAQMRYSLKHFAKLRVNRFQEGIRRLNRLHFLPLSRAFRQRIILQGVWTQCLHACESVKICQTDWSKLRTAAAFGMGFRCTRNAFLALAVVTNRILDPQFCAIIQSLQTCRNVGRFFPDHIDVMEMCLHGQSKFQGVVALLDDRLLEIGWKYEQNFTWTRSGNRFHLFLSNMKHILNILSQSWMCYVAKKVRHRKYLHEATSFRTFDFRHLKGLTFGQRNLLEFQMVGEQFTADVTTHFDPDGENKCKWCGLPDSKQHRFELCVAFSHIRARHPGIIAIWNSLPIEARFFSLWPCDEWHENFQSLLSLIKFPEINRIVNDELVHLFVDGSCQHQAHQDIRISSGSVVRVLPQAEFEVVWSGMTPSSDQQSLRGEILAGCVATASFQKCCIYTDNSTFCSIATGIVDALRNGLTPLVPKEHSDLWVFFFRCLSGSDLHCLRFVKVKGHLDWKTQTTEYLKWTDWYNNLADLVAKQVLISFRDACPEYVQMCRRYFRDLKRAEALAHYHVDIAEYATTGTEKVEVDEFELR